VRAQLKSKRKVCDKNIIVKENKVIVEEDETEVAGVALQWKVLFTIYFKEIANIDQIGLFNRSTKST
jgi:hypothetical protein